MNNETNQPENEFDDLFQYFYKPLLKKFYRKKDIAKGINFINIQLNRISERVKKCGESLFKEPKIKGKSYIDVKNWKIPNVYHCGSVYFCPICNEKRNYTYREALKREYVQLSILNPDLSLVFSTLTTHHNLKTKLKTSLTTLKNTLQRLHKDLPKGFLHFTSIEIVYNKDNGWNAHSHSIYFVENKQLAKEFITKKLEKYIDNKNGEAIQFVNNPENTIDYITKTLITKDYTENKTENNQLELNELTPELINEYYEATDKQKKFSYSSKLLNMKAFKETLKKENGEIIEVDNEYIKEVANTPEKIFSLYNNPHPNTVKKIAQKGIDKTQRFINELKDE